jgi:hypothetical protein
MANLASLGCSSSSSSPTGPSGPYAYSAEELALFDEVIFIDDADDNFLEKWPAGSNIRIRIFETPSSSSVNFLNGVIGEFNGLTAGDGTTMSVVDSAENVSMIFSRNRPPFVPSGRWGGYTIWWHSGGAISSAAIWINTAEDQSWQHRVIRHELTHALGFHHARRASVFNPDRASDFTPLDRSVVTMLHLPDIRPQMTREAALAMLGSGSKAISTIPAPFDHDRDYQSIEIR